MNKCILAILFLLPAIPNCGAAESLNDLLKKLDQTIKEKEIYAEIKEKRILELKHMLNIPQISIEQVYEVNRKLFEEYRVYICDSATCYAEKNLEIAKKQNNKEWIFASEQRLVNILIITGMYIDAIELLNTVNVETLNRYEKMQYYNNYKQICDYYSYNNVYYEKYKVKGSAYRDSLLSFLHPESIHYKIVYSEKLFDEGNLDLSKQVLFDMLQKSTGEDHDYAMITHSIAKIYQKENDTGLQNKYYALSAMADIRNAIKENASMQQLAISVYKSGDINHAYEYICSSLEDAIFCNARLRTVEISKIFPIIETSYKEKTIKQKQQLSMYLLLTAILSFFLIIAVFYVYKQMKRLAIARKELHQVNLQLKELNNQLSQKNLQLEETNHKLFDSNHIKEEYIGHFLDLCSAYIDKLENYRKMLFKKASASQWESLFTTLKSKDFIERELEELYNYFDNIFLHLYPNFIEEFNQLLMEEERFTLKPGELLNPELRIFALFRLGISDSSKIAAFLHYSSSTIYNYRTKVRNKAAVERDEFEAKVMEIGSVLKFTQAGRQRDGQFAW